jgi:hypothetical protein
LIEGGARGGEGDNFRNSLQISLAAVLTLGDLLLSLVISKAYAASGNNEFDEAMNTAGMILDVLGSILSDISGKVGEGLLKVIGGVLGVFMKLKDLFSTLSACSGVDAFLAFSAFATFTIASAVFLSAEVAPLV